MLNVIGSFAEFERGLIKERQAEDIAMPRNAVFLKAESLY